jgi:alkanesulfonate monooxygenase SsuD/methylene tetrahydromethanopterin reductase-like flavin-dependent oxidoreductase (luciferase family)
MKKMVAGIKAEAAALGREIEVFTVGQVVCRPTQKEAEDYYHHAIIEQADWGAIDGMLQIKNITPQTVGAEEYQKKRHYFAARALGGYPFVGSPDHVAEELANLSRGGLRGVAVSFVNYLNEVPFFCGEVLPRLQRMGVREKRRLS